MQACRDVIARRSTVAKTDEPLLRPVAVAAGRRKQRRDGERVRPIGRLGVVTGEFKTAARLIAETVPPPDATNAEAKQGRYLARTVCAGCHGTALRGDTNPDFTSPDLKIVAAYSPDAFAQLMRTGVALGGRNLPVMSETARIHLSQLSDSEIAALYSYLHSLP